MRRVGASVITVLVSLVVVSAAAVPVGAQNEDGFWVELSGEAERPGPGDPNGTGFAHITFDEGTGADADNTICWVVSWRRIQKPTAAHIHHINNTNGTGPVVVTLFDESSDVKGRSHDGCAVVSEALWEDIQENPDEYYVNVHNRKYPAGAIRGDLEDAE